MRNIAIITARSGSKGLKDKNIRPLCGKPLIAYSIEAAIESKMFDRVFVSTDSAEYARISEEYGAKVPFLRSQENSGDNAGSWDVVREVLEKLEKSGETYDNIMLLQPTSPLRKSQDIIDSFKLFNEKKANAVLGVVEMDHSPLWSNTLPDDLCMDDFSRDEYAGVPRQKLPVFYRVNGAIYLLKREELFAQKMFKNKCYAYIMPQSRSVDIDTELDFKLAELMMCE